MFCNLLIGFPRLCAAVFFKLPLHDVETFPCHILPITAYKVLHYISLPMFVLPAGATAILTNSQAMLHKVHNYCRLHLHYGFLCPAGFYHGPRPRDRTRACGGNFYPTSITCFRPFGFTAQLNSIQVDPDTPSPTFRALQGNLRSCL